MIEIKNINKTFGDLQVLKNISLTIEDGEAYGLVGPSGVGKSTLLNCLAGLDSYESGSIIVDGVPLESLGEKQARLFRKNMGIIFQNFSLVSRKNVYQNIALPMECWKVPRSQIKKRVYELAEMVGLKEKLMARPAELSGGQKQRVAIARALTMNPKYILSDESTSSLDPSITVSILNLLDKIRKEMGITIILVTHEMPVVQQFCRQMTIMDAGTATVSGDVRELFFQKPPALQKLLGINEGETIPKSGVNVTFGLAFDTLLWELGKLMEKPYKIINSDFFEFQNQKHGNVTININAEDLPVCENYLQSRGIVYRTERRAL
ncbi:MAG TPA: methionine ABC transporter ATP-binding protein [Lachnoclostridium sp.]|uniref:methionine ABC transporter ATP-binding protein n=1 Tax=Lacrimispora sp. TaxID=2719234 RepID=UPI000EEB61BB|nr:ATP-binding cassette domain-containing protein [Lacrimispora sp.]HCD44206.1 methionine ABC transporter ATP-binding protein [Lachnoclostridium sp.]